MMMWLCAALVVGDLGVGSITGKVVLRDATGGPATADASGAVVYLVGFSDAPAEASARMVQRHQTFLPGVLPVTVGQTVEFANDDPVWHNVFSVSKARAFDLGMTRKPETKSVTFSKTGVIDVYCNIHPQMVGTILVLPNKAFAVTGKDGKFSIGNVPPGTYKAYVWTRRSEPQNKPVTIEANAVAALDFELLQDKIIEPHKDKHGRDYKPAPKY